jgi:uncharacterized membrane protein
VLLIESRPEKCEPLIQALRNVPFDVEVRPPEAIPDQAGELDSFHLLILSNVSAAALTPQRMEAVRKYVEELGGGLIAIGGDQSFTPGGYRGSVLERVLPVVSEPSKVRPKPSLALVLVLDQSASMKGQGMALAKQAARQAVELLGPRDKVGVIAFEDVARWASEIHPCSDKTPVLERIDAIDAGGGTNMYPAMERAYLALEETQADLKHVILLTDGVSNPGDFEGLARQMARSRITVSTVGVGPEVVQPLLEDIAREGKGHYYYCENAASLPRVFVLETTAAGKQGIFEGTSFVKTPQTVELMAGTMLIEKFPALTGYVETRLQPSARLVLETGEGAPLLAWRQCGAGKSVAFMADVEGRWTSAWSRWNGYGPFWTHLARFAMRGLPTSSDRLPETRRSKDLQKPSENLERQKETSKSKGGPFDPLDSKVSTSTETAVPRRTPLWSFLLEVAIILFVADVALKRIDLSRISQ